MKLRQIAPIFACISVFALPALPAYADAVLTLDHGAVWQTAKNGQDTQGFLQIHNTGNAPDTLTSADCTIAARTSLVDAGGNPLQSLAIPPGQTVTLSSSGPHLLIQDAHYPVAKNGILPCAFTFTQSGSLIGYLNAVPPPHS